jgi:hypothetical protein
LGGAQIDLEIWRCQAWIGLLFSGWMLNVGWSSILLAFITLGIAYPLPHPFGRVAGAVHTTFMALLSPVQGVIWFYCAMKAQTFVVYCRNKSNKCRDKRNKNTRCFDREVLHAANRLHRELHLDVVHGCFPGPQSGALSYWLICCVNGYSIDFASENHSVPVLSNTIYRLCFCLDVASTWICIFFRVACRRVKQCEVILWVDDGLPWYTIARTFELPTLVNENKHLKRIRFWCPRGSGNCIGEWKRDDTTMTWIVSEWDNNRAELQWLLDDVQGRSALPIIWHSSSVSERGLKAKFNEARQYTDGVWPPLHEYQ